MTSSGRTSYLPLAAGTILAFGAQATLLVIGFLASYQDDGAIAHQTERYAFGLIIVPIAAVLLQQVVWSTSVPRIHPERLKIPGIQWVAVATGSPVAGFATYILAVGALVAAQTGHNGWTIGLTAGAVATFAAALLATALTIRKAAHEP